MDKNTFDIIMKHYKIENDLYFKLETELGIDKAEELLEASVDYRERLLQIGKYIDEARILNKSGYLRREYNGVPSYTKLLIYYDYNNGFCLCETTSGMFELVPNELIVEEDE